MFFMGVGMLMGAAFWAWLAGGDLGGRPSDRLLAQLGGVVWALGSLGYAWSVQTIGLSRSTPIKNTTAIFGTLYGILIFHEFTFSDVPGLIMSVLGSIAIVAAAILLGAVTSPAEQHTPIPKRTFLFGVLGSAIAAVSFSFYAIPLKIAVGHGMSPTGFLFYMGQGACAGMCLIALASRRPARRAANGPSEFGLLPLLSGLIWASASACCNSAIKLIGVTIAWPIANLNTLVAVGYGVWILHEVRVAHHRRELVLGLGAATLGVVLLAMAMGR